MIPLAYHPQNYRVQGRTTCSSTQITHQLRQLYLANVGVSQNRLLLQSLLFANLDTNCPCLLHFSHQRNGNHHINERERRPRLPYRPWVHLLRNLGNLLFQRHKVERRQVSRNFHCLPLVHGISFLSLVRMALIHDEPALSQVQVDLVQEQSVQRMQLDLPDDLVNLHKRLLIQ